MTVTSEKSISTYNDSGTIFLYNNNNDDYKGTIHSLDLAQGLIQLLVENNFTLKSLLNTRPSELCKALCIGQEVAAIICAVANKKKKMANYNHYVNRFAIDYCKNKK